MTGREKYEVYREMTDEIPELEARIRQSLSERDYKIYSVFLAVADEENKLYFCDIEYGGSPEKYNRIYKNLSKETIVKHFYLKEDRKQEVKWWIVAG